jgi:hypothetical protein
MYVVIVTIYIIAVYVQVVGQILKKPYDESIMNL